MIFEAAPVRGVHVVKPEPRSDDRGFFARVFCEREFAAHGLETRFVQANTSLSLKRGTLRGMHYQIGASAEVKLVRCTSGAVFDVALDLRPDSPTFGRWFGTELNSKNLAMLYVPRGCAHGFATLEDNSEVSYLVSTAYDQPAERCVRFDDKRFAIAWPIAIAHVSPKDGGAPDFDPARNGIDQLRGLLTADA